MKPTMISIPSATRSQIDDLFVRLARTRHVPGVGNLPGDLLAALGDYSEVHPGDVDLHLRRIHGALHAWAAHDDGGCGWDAPVTVSPKVGREDEFITMRLVESTMRCVDAEARRCGYAPLAEGHSPATRAASARIHAALDRGEQAAHEDVMIADAASIRRAYERPGLVASPRVHAQVSA